MHQQLEILLEIQDLRSQVRALQEEGEREVESEVFEMPMEEAIGKIEQKLEELEGRLQGTVERRYRRIRQRHDRIVVPVVDGICYGCFMAVPTSWASDAERNQALDTCDHCGRFLYHLD